LEAFKLTINFFSFSFFFEFNFFCGVFIILLGFD
jgi:hypothetical protein